MSRKPHEFAGQTVKIRADVAEIGGQEYRVEDWWINLTGQSWMYSDGNPAAIRYAMRSGPNVPIDDDVLYGKIGGLGWLVHASEIEVQS